MNSLLNINNDYNRFRQIIKGKIKDNLRKYISSGELIGRKGKDLVSIPLPQIDIPRFRFGNNGNGGAGQGNGDPGDPVGTEETEPGKGKAGNLPGIHIKEVELTINELAEILGDELCLPNIEPKGKKEIITQKDKYSGIRRSGPESLRHFKRTFREALKRQVLMGKFEIDAPKVIPIKDDFRYRSWKITSQPETNAAIIYMMDVSGSMWDEQKQIVRTETFWIDTWLHFQYKGIETCYIIHDAQAQEVERETFFSTRESGGTVISTAYELCDKIIDERYPASDWNIYAFHFSDGDNWGREDNQKCAELLEKYLLLKVNLFGYGQVDSTYGSGEFFNYLQNKLGEKDNLILSHIPDKENIYQSIKVFLGKGI
jgi:sporulation protein YhbH